MKVLRIFAGKTKVTYNLTATSNSYSYGFLIRENWRIDQKHIFKDRETAELILREKGE